jgi:hypothetical protein
MRRRVYTQEDKKKFADFTKEVDMGNREREREDLNKQTEMRKDMICIFMPINIHNVT